jgi:hypothetical protein
VVAPVTSLMSARRASDVPGSQGAQRSCSFSYGQGLATPRLTDGQAARWYLTPTSDTNNPGRKHGSVRTLTMNSWPHHRRAPASRVRNDRPDKDEVRPKSPDRAPGAALSGVEPVITHAWVPIGSRS